MIQSKTPPPSVTDVPSARSTAPALISATLVAALFALNVAAFVDAGLVVDSGRDMASAWLIAQGSHFPLTGPDIFATWKLGPIWFYVLAVPFALGGSLTAMALWVGLLSSLKIPLAWLLGRRCYGPAGGLGLAALLAMPGWGSASAMVLAHTSLTETGVLASILTAWWAYRQPSGVRLGLAALTLALAMHAHPTAIVTTPWLIAALWQLRHADRRWIPLLAAVAGFWLPWLPMLVAEAMSGWPQFAATAQYLGSGESANWLQTIQESTRGLLTGAPVLVADILLRPAGLPSAWLSVVWAGALLLAVIGTLPAAISRPGFTALVWLQLAGAIVFVSALRQQLPMYMAFALLPLAAWACLHGWQGLMGQRLLPLLVWPLAALALIGQFGELRTRATELEHGSRPVPGAAYGNVALAVEDDGYLRPWLAVGDQQAAVDPFCSADIALHGELAATLHLASNVAIANACPEGQRPWLLGADASQHVLGLPVAVAGRLGITGDPLVRGWVSLVPNTIVHPPRGSMATVDPEYAVNRFRRQPPSVREQLSVRCSGEQVLAISNSLPALNPLDIIVTGETPIEPEIVSLVGRYYRCQPGDELSIVVQTPTPAAIDIVLFDRR